MPRRKNIHVVPTSEGWAVKNANASRADSVYRTQQEAIDRGRKLAKNNQSELLIHNRNGQIREKNSYGNDPRSSPG